jgi:hypothetical protein
MLITRFHELWQYAIAPGEASPFWLDPNRRPGTMGSFSRLDSQPFAARRLPPALVKTKK